MNSEEFTEYSKTEWPKVREKLEELAKKNGWKAELYKDNCVSRDWSICIRNNNRCVVGGFSILGGDPIEVNKAYKEVELGDGKSEMVEIGKREYNRRYKHYLKCMQNAEKESLD